MQVDHKDMVAKNKVSLIWQCLASPFWITGLIAFSRIKRLQNGILLYVLTQLSLAVVLAVVIGVSSLSTSSWDKIDQSHATFAYSFGLVGLAVMIGVPVYFMRKWCIKWNQGFETQVT